MEYCCHAWAGAPNCYLDLLDKLQKWICRTIGLSLAASFETLGSLLKCWQLKSSIGITLVDVHLNWPNWFHFIILEGGLLVILIGLHEYSGTIPRCYNDVYSFFPCTARLWDSLPLECFPLTYDDLNSFKSRVDRHLLTVGSF